MFKTQPVFKYMLHGLLGILNTYQSVKLFLEMTSNLAKTRILGNPTSAKELQWAAMNLFYQLLSVLSMQKNIQCVRRKR